MSVEKSESQGPTGHAEAIESWLFERESAAWSEFYTPGGNPTFAKGLEPSRIALAGIAESAIESFAQDEAEALRMRGVIEVLLSSRALEGYVLKRAHVWQANANAAAHWSDGDDSVE